MKKLNIFFLILFSSLFLFSCGGNEETVKVNTDAIGEADAQSPEQGKESENIVKATINGKDMTFSFMDIKSPNDKVFTLSESKDKKYTIWGFELGTDAKLKEKIAIMIINHDISNAQYPLTLPKGKIEGKQIKLDLYVQKSNVFIPYNNTDNFNVTITKVSDSSIEGTFAGEVKNQGNRIIKIENGSFDIKIQKMEMKLQ
jgi:hypothetical protein